MGEGADQVPLQGTSRRLHLQNLIACFSSPEGSLHQITDVDKKRAAIRGSTLASVTSYHAYRESPRQRNTQEPPAFLHEEQKQGEWTTTTIDSGHKERRVSYE